MRAWSGARVPSGCRSHGCHRLADTIATGGAVKARRLARATREERAVIRWRGET